MGDNDMGHLKNIFVALAARSCWTFFSWLLSSMFMQLRSKIFLLLLHEPTWIAALSTLTVCLQMLPCVFQRQNISVVWDLLVWL